MSAPKLMETCPECGGDTYVAESGMDHHPDCDGNCRRCPIEVLRQEPCPTCGGYGEVEVDNAPAAVVEVKREE